MLLGNTPLNDSNISDQDLFRVHVANHLIHEMIRKPTKFQSESKDWQMLFKIITSKVEIQNKKLLVNRLNWIIKVLSLNKSEQYECKWLSLSVVPLLFASSAMFMRHRQYCYWLSSLVLSRLTEISNLYFYSKDNNKHKSRNIQCRWGNRFTANLWK